MKNWTVGITERAVPCHISLSQLTNATGVLGVQQYSCLSLSVKAIVKKNIAWDSYFRSHGLMLGTPPPYFSPGRPDVFTPDRKTPFPNPPYSVVTRDPRGRAVATADLTVSLSSLGATEVLLQPGVSKSHTATARPTYFVGGATSPDTLRPTMSAGAAPADEKPTTTTTTLPLAAAGHVPSHPSDDPATGMGTILVPSEAGGVPGSSDGNGFLLGAAPQTRLPNHSADTRKTAGCAVSGRGGVDGEAGRAPGSGTGRVGHTPRRAGASAKEARLFGGDTWAYEFDPRDANLRETSAVAPTTAVPAVSCRAPHGSLGTTGQMNIALCSAGGAAGDVKNAPPVENADLGTADAQAESATAAAFPPKKSSHHSQGEHEDNLSRDDRPSMISPRSLAVEGVRPTPNATPHPKPPALEAPVGDAIAARSSEQSSEFGSLLRDRRPTSGGSALGDDGIEGFRGGTESLGPSGGAGETLFTEGVANGKAEEAVVVAGTTPVKAFRDVKSAATKRRLPGMNRHR